MEEAFTWQQKKKKNPRLDSDLEKPEAALHAECSVVRSLHQLVRAHAYTHAATAAQHKPAARTDLLPPPPQTCSRGSGRVCFWWREPPAEELQSYRADKQKESCSNKAERQTPGREEEACFPLTYCLG